MKSIQRRFLKNQNKNIGWSSYVCFAEAIRRQKLSKKIIMFWFNKLVEKDDYCKSEKKGVLQHLYNLTNSAEDGIKLKEIKQ